MPASRSAPITPAPASWNTFTIERPIPPPAPETSTFLPSSRHCHNVIPAKAATPVNRGPRFRGDDTERKRSPSTQSKCNGPQTSRPLISHQIYLDLAVHHHPALHAGAGGRVLAEIALVDAIK